jgi:hypothetical protein
MTTVLTSALRPRALEEPCLRHGKGYDTSCMKALRRVKSFEEFLASFFWRRRAWRHTNTRAGTALERSRRGMGGVRFSIVRDFSLAAVGLPEHVRSIAHLLVLVVSS